MKTERWLKKICKDGSVEYRQWISGNPPPFREMDPVYMTLRERGCIKEEEDYLSIKEVNLDEVKSIIKKQRKG